MDGTVKSAFDDPVLGSTLFVISSALTLMVLYKSVPKIFSKFSHATKTFSSREIQIYDYIKERYWNSKKSVDTSKKHWSPLMRISRGERHIHIVYSKSTLEQIVSRVISNTTDRVQFAYIFKGLKTLSLDETRARFDEVTDDHLSFE